MKFLIKNFLLAFLLTVLPQLATPAFAQVEIAPRPFITSSGSALGPILFTDGTTALPSVTAASQTNKGFSFTISNYVTLSGNGAAVWQAGGTGLGKGQFFASDASIGFSTTTNPNATTDVFIRRSGTSTITFDTDGAAGNLTAINFDATTNSFAGSIVLPTNRFYLFSGQGGLSNTGNGVNRLTNNAASSTFVVQTTGAPTCTANCGTSPSVSGSDSTGKVTMGASGVPASAWVLTFNGTWSTAPACVVVSALSSMVVGKMAIAVVTSTTTMTVTTNGTAPSTSDAYYYHCFSN